MSATAPVTAAVTVPAPAPCVWCSGASCNACGSTGVGPVEFGLGKTHSYEVREGMYTPTGRASGRLTLVCRKTPKTKAPTKLYLLSEFPCDFDGRGFELKKVGDEEVRQVFLGRDGSVSCSCHAGCYDPSGKANQRAREADREQYDTTGCAHGDALRGLLAKRYFDLSGGRG